MGIDLELDSSSRRNLPDGGEAFLDELSTVLDEERVRSVLLFGSVVTGEATDHSDVDLIIVLEDAASNAYAERVRSECSTLAERHLGINNYISDPLGRFVDRQTGMFRSGFVTRVSDVKSGDFPAIFNTNRLAYFLAPWRSVLAGVFETTETIYGPEIRPSWEGVTHPTNQSTAELVRNWLMTLLLAIGQTLYVLVSTRAMHYSMEAYKWTAYTCAYHVLGSPARSLARALDAIPSISLFDEWFLSLRDEPRLELSFILITPLVVSLVHVRTIRHSVTGTVDDAGLQGE